MKTTKRIICIFLALTFALLVGCKDNSLPVDRVVAETDTHRVFYSNEKCYIEFFEDLKYSGKSNLLSIEEVTAVKVQNADELCKKIVENDFTFEEKRMIYYATTDENGDLERCVFDIEKMYQPVFPENTELKHLVWHGLPYYLYVARYAESFLVYVSYYEKDYYSEVYKREITDEIAKLEASDSYTVTQVKDKNAIEYRSDTDMYICYDIEDNGRNITVLERYWLDNDLGYPNSDTVPFYIYMYVTEDDVNYEISMDDIYKYFNEHPGEEWLLSFGMEPYVPAGE